MFQSASGFSLNSDTEAAFLEAMGQLVDALDGTPHWVLLSTTQHHELSQLKALWARHYPACRVHGVTSSQGMMTQAGHHVGKHVLGVWGISDQEGSYGVGMAALSDLPEEDAQQALLAALDDADRPGELPSLVWIHGSPGHEEAFLTGIQAVVGDDVPIVGGSSADDGITGDWYIWDRHDSIIHGVSLTVMFPDAELTDVFESGYGPTSKRGTVTRAEGRWVYEIDGRPAADVYDEWSGNILASVREGGGGVVLSESVLWPIGRPFEHVEGMPYYLLSHAEFVNEEGHMRFFTAFSEGDTVVLMNGAQEQLVERAGRLATQARELSNVKDEALKGALIIYCAGCMMKVGDEMSDVSAHLNTALPNVPYMGVFTFGEQGCMANGLNKHGNLMISVLLFTQRQSVV